MDGRTVAAAKPGPGAATSGGTWLALGDSMHRAALLVWLAVAGSGCHSAMVQYAGGAMQGTGGAGRSGVGIDVSAGAGDSRDGKGIAGTASLVFTDEMALLVEQGQLQVIGKRWGAVRFFGRAGLGFNLGWIDGDFGGGGAASAELGAAFGRSRDVITLHARAARFGRVGEAPGETMFGVYLGYAVIWRDDD